MVCEPNHTLEREGDYITKCQHSGNRKRDGLLPRGYHYEGGIDNGGMRVSSTDLARLRVLVGVPFWA